MINNIIILAAGSGSRLMPLTKKIPKCMVKVSGQSIIEWQVEVARKAGIKNIIVVAGHYHQEIKIPDIRKIINKDYKTTNMVESLKCASDFFDNGFILSYGDILYNQSVIHGLLNHESEISVTVDLEWKKYWEQRFDDPLTDAETLKIDKNNHLIEIGSKTNSYDDIEAQYIGLLRFSERGVNVLKGWLEEDYQDKNMYVTDMLQSIIEKGNPPEVYKIKRNWLEIDSISDLKVAEGNSHINQKGDLEINN